MVRKDSSLLGIDLHEQEIRVVQIDCRSNKPTLGKIGRAAMPEGAILNGRILHIAPVAVALRLLLNSMGIGTTSRAVIGVNGDATSLRTLSVPPVPDHELGTIIAGEVAHYGLVRSPGGAYVYIRLTPPSRATSSDQAIIPSTGDKRETLLDPEGGDQNPSVVTVLAVEEDILFALRQVVEQANVTVEALEPAQYSMFRSVMLAGGATATLFALMVNPGNTDIIFVHKGTIVGYRRIDIGSRLLTLEYTTASDAPGAPLPTATPAGLDEFGQPVAAAGSAYMNRLAVEGLSVEIQRTLNYYQREFPTSSIEDHIYLAFDDGRLEDLPRELTLELGVTVEAVRPSLIPVEAQDANTPGLGSVYAAAFGLAYQGPMMSRVGRLDLFLKQRAGVQQAETKRNFWGSVLISLLAVALGVVGYGLYHKQVAELESQTEKTNARATKIRAETNTTVQLRHKAQEQYKALRSEGVPVLELMDFVAASVKTGTGLQSVQIAPDLTVTIEGQSLTEAMMIDTNQALQKCPVLTDLRIVSFKHLQPEEGVGVSFELVGKTFSIGKIRLPEDKPVTIVPGPSSPASPIRRATSHPSITSGVQKP